jgi:zinc-ribbon domain
MTTACLYCGLQLADTAEFCPECGRPIERDFEIRPFQPSAWDRPGKEMKAKDDLQGQHVVFSHGSGPLAPVKNIATLDIAHSAEHLWPGTKAPRPLGSKRLSLSLRW